VQAQTTMQAAEALQILRETQVVREGHFRLTSGLHTDLFLLCSLVQQFPHHTARLAQAMAEPFQSSGVQVVAGTAMGGIILAYEVARALGVRGVFAEKGPEGRMVLRRGFRLAPGERVLVVEDAVSTGGSIKKVIDVLRTQDAEVVGVAALVDRSGGQVDLGVPLRALITLTVPMWEPAACPMCRSGVPVVDPKDFTEAPPKSQPRPRDPA